MVVVVVVRGNIKLLRLLYTCLESLLAWSVYGPHLQIGSNYSLALRHADYLLAHKLKSLNECSTRGKEIDSDPDDM